MLTELQQVSPAWSAQFIFVAARLSAAITVVPVLGARGVPPQAKLGIALLLSFIVLPLQREPATEAPTNLLVFAAILGSEVLVGLALGVAAMLAVQAMEMGASLVGVQLGFGLGEVFDPLTGAQSNVIEQFYRLLVTLVFFAVNGHHLVIAGLVRSFEVVPPGTADLTLIAGERAVPFFAALFALAVRVALPVTVALLLTDLVLGIVGRAVPQMNVLVAGLGVKAGVGLFVMFISMPMLVAFIGSSLTSTLVQANSLLRP